MAAERVDLRTELPPNVHLHAARRRGPAPAARLRFMRRVRAPVPPAGARDAVRRGAPAQPGRGGREPRPRRRSRRPSCSARTCPTGPLRRGRRRASCGPVALRGQARRCARPSSGVPTTVLLSTPAAASKLEPRRAAALARARAARPASTTGAWRPRDRGGSGPGRALPGEPRGPQGHPRAARRLRPARAAPARCAAARRRRRARSRRRPTPRRELAGAATASSCSGRSSATG